MSVCSIHQTPVADCPGCQDSPQDIFPDWDEKVREAEEAGTTDCEHCEFTYYKTTTSCPRCGKEQTPE